MAARNWYQVSSATIDLSKFSCYCCEVFTQRARGEGEERKKERGISVDLASYSGNRERKDRRPSRVSHTMNRKSKVEI